MDTNCKETIKKEIERMLAIPESERKGDGYFKETELEHVWTTKVGNFNGKVFAREYYIKIMMEDVVKLYIKDTWEDRDDPRYAMALDIGEFGVDLAAEIIALIIERSK